MKPAELIAVIEGLWGPTQGDAEEAVRAREVSLGLALPPVLRAVYRHTGLRQGATSHLRPLDALEIDAGNLIFANESQATAFWGIPLRNLQDPDPPVCYGALGDYRDEGCTCSDLLLLVAFENRPWMEPMAVVGLHPSAIATLPGWREQIFTLRSVGRPLSFWTNGEAVVSSEGSGEVGARDRDALRRVLIAFGAEEDLEDYGLAPEPGPPIDEQLARIASARTAGDATSAEALAMDLVVAHDSDARAWVALGLVERMQGSTQGAADACDAALARDPECLPALALRALLAHQEAPVGLDEALWPELAGR